MGAGIKQKSVWLVGGLVFIVLWIVGCRGTDMQGRQLVYGSNRIGTGFQCVEEQIVVGLNTALEDKKQEKENRITELLHQMTLQQKVCQMFITEPESVFETDMLTVSDQAITERLQAYPIGGLIWFPYHLVDADQTISLLDRIQSAAAQIEGIPLLMCIDEEGGRVAKISNHEGFDVQKVGPMADITEETQAYEAGATIGSYLESLGFNVDFAPDADVLTNPNNQVIGDRSFGMDPWQVTALAIAYSDGLHSYHVMSTFKHFPGHGATEGDTHEGFAYTSKCYEELKEAELIPFAEAEAAGVDMIMVSHISVPNITGDDIPCTLSHRMVTEMLRGNLGYEGIVVSDAMNMGAVTQMYSSGEAAVMAVQAGIDLILMPENFKVAVDAVVEAVRIGEIKEEQIDASVHRIIEKKLGIQGR